MEPLTIERMIKASPEKIWSALTDKDQIAKWFVPVPEFKAEPGCEFTFVASDKDSKGFRHLCKVIEVIPNKKLSYSWRYDGYEGSSVVTFELFPEGKGTKLKLTHAGLETFPQTPDFARNNYREGWAAITAALQALTEVN
jgi:uncharacterized protein YndB with AHSA1/START domain